MLLSAIPLFSPSPLENNIASCLFKQQDSHKIKGSGYVVKSIEAALWAFYHGNDFKEGALLAVNLGDDADTTGAIYGQLAGAFYGEEGIPQEWKDGLVKRELIEHFAKDLYKHVIR